MRIEGLTGVGITPYAKKMVGMKRPNSGDPTLAPSREFQRGQGEGQQQQQPAPRPVRKEIVA